MTKILDYDAWVDTYKPQVNPNGDPELFGGCMFETYGSDQREVARVRDKEPDKIWTMLDTDGVVTINPGYSHVNRMGYFITKIPFYSHELEIPV